MSIVTRKGDKGTTALMYNRRVSKQHPRIEAYGSVDELTSALGVARAATRQEFVRGALLEVQKDLVILMGELAVLPEDRERYVRDGYSLVTPELTGKLDKLVLEIEAQIPAFRDWALPGARPDAAALEMARAVARRAERRVGALPELELQQNPEMIIYLNRLSDVLWLLARWVEQQSAKS